ncbi:MAG: flagellin [Magnetococcales bacterium]|nr:flagellin [Magnetococcales bacterium]
MAIFISSNTYAQSAAYALSTNSGSLNSAFERLSSGLRINRAKDDVAGLAISTHMDTAIRSQNQSIQDLGDAISMTQIADGGLQDGAQIMQRMRQLAVQSANDANGPSDRQSLQDEFAQLKTQLDQLTANTEFNGQNLLDGSMDGKKIQVGGAGNATDTLTWLSTDNSRVAAAQQGAVLSDWWSAATTAAGGSPPSLLTQDQSEAAIGTLSDAIDAVASQRAQVGAFENRLTSLQNSLSSSVVNISAARSRIQDADIAQETAKMTSRSIIQSATAAVLAQANQQPELAMKLLD